MVNKNNQNTSKQEISSLREDIDVLRKEIEAVEDKYLAVHRGESRESPMGGAVATS